MPVADEIVWQMFFLFLGSAALAAVMTVIVILFVMFTPARTWLGAKIHNKPIIAAMRRDRKIDYHTAKEYAQGLVLSEDYGAFIVDDDSVYLSKKGGVPVLSVNSEVGITLSPKVLRMIDGLKRSGIDNIEEAEELADVWGECDCAYEGPLIPINMGEREGKMVVKLVCPNDEKTLAVMKTLEEMRNDPTRDITQHAEDGHADPGPNKDV